MRARRLIINADGFGFGPGATQGILDAIRRGRFISSVSVNANFPEVCRLRDLINEFPEISVGVHLNPMVGRPCLPVSSVPTLVGSEGFFHEERFFALLRSGAINLKELQCEFDAQIQMAREYAGNRLTHVDSQENSHLSYLNLFLSTAQRWGLQRMRNNASLICLESDSPFRSRTKVYSHQPSLWLGHRYRKYQMCKARVAGMRMADRLVTVGYTGCGNKAVLENWLRILRNLPPGTNEIYCHPAYPDETLRRWSTYCDNRKGEFETLCHPELRDAARRSNIEIISFDHI
jgi:predicted glycoside hydrolase/deacetylase ChbG (UPF0249 family)